MPFFSSLRTEWVEWKRGISRHKLLAPLRYSVKIKGVELTVKVPEGFVTDFASVPWFLRGLLPADGKYTKAAVVHDYLCEIPEFDQVLSDAIFRAAMKELKVPWWRRIPMFYGVRIYQAIKGRF